MSDKVIDVEVDEDTAEAKIKEKKPNIFKKLGNKIKSEYNDVKLENAIKQAFIDNNCEAYFYTSTGILNLQTFYVENHIEDGYVLVFGADKPKCDNTAMTIKKDSEDVYKVLSVEEASVDVVVDGVSYNRAAYKVLLGNKLNKVKVIKVEDSFYLYN